MQLRCPRCDHVLEYADKRPAFCAYCGRPIPPLDAQATAPFDAEAATLPPTTQIRNPSNKMPESVGGYRLIRTLGCGGMGTVYEAEETATGRRVAVKLIAPEFAGSPDTITRFRQEGRLASLVVHPRCVFVHKADEEAGLPYLVMELMPGPTLQHLVEERGPLAQADAVAKMLDVIEGLQEAHRLGIIHRDVKPSNCFLEADGRVKLGDFGLSKSLLQDARLTRAGAFMGTPLYASPEQIRAEPVDQQSDVYSVAATLYFLLTGQAPHQTGDAAATMARIVSEAAPSLRSVRPELSQALDEVVLRGLERDRGRRWANLEELRHALLPFAPEWLSLPGLAARFAAFLIDLVVVLLLEMPIALFVTWLLTGDARSYFNLDYAAPEWSILVSAATWMGYFGLLEGLRGATLGKRALRLKVCAAASHDPPNLPRAFLRAGTFFLLLSLGTYVSLVLDALDIPAARTSAATLGSYAFWTWGVILGATVLGPLLLLCTLRARTGYRGLHEWVSGTRVIALTAREQRRVIPLRRLEDACSPAPELPEQLGDYVVLGLLGRAGVTQVLLAEDPALGRKVMLRLGPADELPVSEARQELSRPARLRWLNGGTLDGLRWDAFVTPVGSPVADLVARDGRLPWPEVRPWLEQLAEELSAATADGTLPRELTTGQVWVQPNGRIQLLDFTLDPTSASGAAPLAVSDEERAVELLREVAVLALEGQARKPGDEEPRLRAPLPGHAVRLGEHLLDRTESPLRLRAWQQDLNATRSLPTSVTWTGRLAHLELLAAFLFVGLFTMLLGPVFSSHERAVALGSSSLDEGVRWLHAEALALAAGSVNPQPFAPALAALQVQAKLHILTILEPLVDKRRIEYQARLHCQGWLVRSLTVWEVQQNRDPSGPEEGMPLPVLCFLVSVWPAVWVLWAFFFRGGFAYRMTGIALVREDGRPAARWQCGVRALLVWLPVVVLLVLSICLEEWYVANAASSGPRPWMPWLSWACWWLGVALLPAYVALALRQPARTLHDRWVGTYLVPRN